MSKIASVEEFLSLSEGDTIYHINPFSAKDNKFVNIEEMIISSIESGQVFYGDQYHFIEDMLRDLKVTFTDFDEATKWHKEYQEGPQFRGVIKHHAICCAEGF